ncbi:S1 RNA-binding domain-containing protein [Patescibacteria group bacterium AH-259-L05]|nr:S1 RNA-binding domain-containing protein [Patescibacteria group bacterium AH-259-L05]
MAVKQITIKKDYNTLIQSMPRVNELIEGEVIEIGKNEIYINIEGILTGVIRGPELYDESGEFSDLKKGDKVSTTVLELENEKGFVELSLRYASHQKAWNKLESIAKNKKTVMVKIIGANKGGLLIQYGKIQGFMPVSQLKHEHYPRVEGGDKNKILEKLKKFVGTEMEVKFITVDEKEEKLIVSEKEIASKQKKESKEKQYKVGDVVEGKITGLVDFGAFVTFDKNQEGLVHISEIGWQRIDHPQDILSIGDKVKIKIIEITEDGKISLSIRRLIEDPWKDIKERYSIGQKVKGKILKINAFGFFVELDSEIHGLAHVSEITAKPTKDLNKIAKTGDVLEFKIVSIEPKDHRLGLSLIKAKPKEQAPLSQTKTKQTEKDET